MSKTVNNFYVTANGDLEEAHELLVEVARLEDERDNALLERDEAVEKASELAQKLSDSRATIKCLEQARDHDWEKLKSWNNLTREKHEEVLRLQKKEKALHGLLNQKDEHIQELVTEYEKSIDSLNERIEDLQTGGVLHLANREIGHLQSRVKGLQADLGEYKEAFERALKDREAIESEMDERCLALSRQRDKAIQEMKLRGDAIERQEKQIEQLRSECANKRLQIKGLQAELAESDRERNAWKTRALERQGRAEGLRAELIEAQNELDATKESGQYFADRTDALTQQAKDLQDQLDEAKKFARSWQDMYNNLEIQRSLAEHSATYWHDKYYGTTS